MDEARHPARRGMRIDDLALGASTQGPLRRILDLVQGTPGAVLADVRVATLERAQIETLSRLALREADACVDRSRMLLHLLELSMPRCAPDPQRVTEITQHAARLITDAKIWRELAGNATFYVEHPDVAARLRHDLAGAPRAPVEA
ncbi:hypothetical protein [Luteimonas sp. FCS-9]|uniref:hypothetical protein n=1 Tax=Luteimonas sp. FCS-9 TaxID=1547516 RepID=UPI00063E7368|nr:hypothetical protein [Luteimonas sp. FCS-9]KLI98715.1 hypothetical protein WQ56_14375 [Luteimonas sp. FCS-9]